MLCLAFPLHPPGRPEKSRLAELDAVDVPVLVVQGASDPFGMPPDGPGRSVVVVPGNHSLRGDLDAVGAAVREWLGVVLPGRRRACTSTAALRGGSGGAGGRTRPRA